MRTRERWGRSRTYLAGIRRSLGKGARALLGLRGAALHSSVPAFLVKALCRSDPLDRAREHSLLARVDSTREISRLSANDETTGALYAQGSRLATTYGALLAANEAPLDNRPLDLARLDRGDTAGAVLRGLTSNTTLSGPSTWDVLLQADVPPRWRTVSRGRHGSADRFRRQGSGSRCVPARLTAVVG